MCKITHIYVPKHVNIHSVLTSSMYSKQINELQDLAVEQKRSSQILTKRNFPGPSGWSQDTAHIRPCGNNPRHACRGPRPGKALCCARVTWDESHGNTGLPPPPSPLPLPEASHGLWDPLGAGHSLASRVAGHKRLPLGADPVSRDLAVSRTI